MTTTDISIQDLVQREVIYCVSTLIYDLTQERKLDDNLVLCQLINDGLFVRISENASAL